MAGAGEGYEVDFLKKCLFFLMDFFNMIFFHEWARRGRSRRENSGKILAAAFSRRDFLMIFGGGVGSREIISFLIVPGRTFFNRF